MELALLHAYCKIRKILITTSKVSTLAGADSGFVDGNGTAARFLLPAGITFVSSQLFVADTRNSVIRKILLN